MPVTNPASPKPAAASPPRRWWREPRKRDQLLEIGAREAAAYVYDLEEVDAAVAILREVRSVDRWAYAMKANWHPQILRRLYTAGLTLECVSQSELEHAFDSVPDLSPARVLFTPNFAPKAEYRFGFEIGVRVTLDNLHPLSAWPELFAGQEIFVRIDPGVGRGHHQHVRTAGAHAKFGVPLSDIDELCRLTQKGGVRVVGLHAHTGSGIFDVANWIETGELLGSLASRFADVSVVDLGGGIGVPDREQDSGIDFSALQQGIASLKKRFPHMEFWMEPGRFLVARAGVLIAQVTQLKGKGDIRFVGIATGMNSLIRPALYGAHHDVVNLTRLEQAATQLVNVVGPICETADVLATDRLMPPAEEGDVLLFDVCGAYGYVMASHYNRRAPAPEVCIEP
jgi:bifunctional diaminopimelate decarboxylase / aspartate kinase